MNNIILKTSLGRKDYYLNEENLNVLRIRYNEELQTARFKTDHGRRVIIIDEEGFLSYRIAIKNEYGIPLGHLNYDNFSTSTGSVIIDDNKFRFALKKDENILLEIFQGAHHRLLYSCQLPFSNAENNFSKSNFNLLIISVCWYLLSSNVAEVNLFLHKKAFL